MDKVGRCPLLLVGSVIMAVGYLALDVLALTSCAEALSHRACIETSPFSPVRLITATILLALALSWGPVCWICPFELFSTQSRAVGVAALFVGICCPETKKVELEAIDTTTATNCEQSSPHEPYSQLIDVKTAAVA